MVAAVLVTGWCVGWPLWLEYEFEAAARGLKAGVDIEQLDERLDQTHFAVFGYNRQQAMRYQLKSCWYLKLMETVSPANSPTIG
jgi:hypothetical protein